MCSMLYDISFGPPYLGGVVAQSHDSPELWNWLLRTCCRPLSYKTTDCLKICKNFNNYLLQYFPTQQWCYVVVHTHSEIEAHTVCALLLSHSLIASCGEDSWSHHCITGHAEETNVLPIVTMRCTLSTVLLPCIFHDHDNHNVAYMYRIQYLQHSTSLKCSSYATNATLPVHGFSSFFFFNGEP